jgi:hypothetical protein
VCEVVRFYQQRGVAVIDRFDGYITQYLGTVEREGTLCLELRCSSYHQNSALYPITDYLQRMLQFDPEETPAARLEKL